MSKIPPRLKAGDEIRIIAPSRSMSVISTDCQKMARSSLSKLGLRLSFGEHCAESDAFNSSSIESRLKDLHAAFADSNVKGILTVIGGYNSNQLLPYIDYTLIKKNPKVFCGYSDITALQNAFLHKSQLVTYSGPHFSTFGCQQGMEYVIEHFKRTLFQNQTIEVQPSDLWSDDEWYLDQENRVFVENDGYWVISEGSAEGLAVGGNLPTFSVLCGTEYMPNLKDTILFLEVISANPPEAFDRLLQHITMQRHTPR